MPKNNIHPAAIVETGAVIGTDVTVEPYAVVKKGVTLRDGVVVKSHAYVGGQTTVGEGTSIFPFACIGTKPQHRRFSGDNTQVVIGKGCEIREYVTINASCQEGSQVCVGDNCFIMAYAHIAHNCEIGNNVTMANHATLAGHIVVEDFATIGGMTAVHQFVRIGCWAMVGGVSRVPKDVPPYTIGGGIPYKFGGLNLVGLKRNGFDLESRRALSQAFRYTYRKGLHLQQALETIGKEVRQTPEVKHWVDFCRNSKRGLLGLQGSAIASTEEGALLEEYASDYDVETSETLCP